MKPVRKFEAFDGKVFDTQNEALNYELRATTTDKIKDEFKITFSTNRADSFLIAILSNPKFMRDTLTDYIRRIRIENESEFQKAA